MEGMELFRFDMSEFFEMSSQMRRHSFSIVFLLHDESLNYLDDDTTTTYRLLSKIKKRKKKPEKLWYFAKFYDFYFQFFPCKFGASRLKRIIAVQTCNYCHLPYATIATTVAPAKLL